MRTCTALRLLLVATFVVTSHRVSAKAPAGMRPVPAGIGEIRGTITDSVSGRAVTPGSITVRQADDSSFAGGSLPKADGTFRVDGLVAGRYTLRIRALGIGPFVRRDIVISPAKPVVDVGSIELHTVVATLEGQLVVAERAAQSLRWLMLTGHGLC